MIARLTCILIACATGLSAQPLSFPSNASLARETLAPDTSFEMPLGAWDGTKVPTETVEGRVTKQAWRINAASLTTLQLMRPLREQIRNDRFDIIFECETHACGGFDFRFGVQTLPPPEMQINIGDFRFLAARKVGDNGPEALGLFVSRTAQAGFVQMIHVGPDDVESPVAVASQQTAPLPTLPVSVAALERQFGETGRTILDGLAFETGSAQLGTSDVPALQVLADFLRAYPERRVALVGHTDASGDLAPNIALSKRRAASVAERLIADFDIPRTQLNAEGMGYLSPLATNLTPQGRETNRRVEVIILPDPN